MSATQGARGTGNIPASQRPGSFGKGTALAGNRVTRDDVKKMRKKRGKGRSKK